MTISRQRPRVVLLVQPDRDDRTMYTEFLRHAGLIVVSPDNATAALPLAPQADIIVTGILLSGGIDGIDFVARVRADDRTKDTPIIVLTACAWHTERGRAVAAGCDMFLTKPCLPDDLLREIRLLTARRLRDVRRPNAKAALRGTHRR